MTPDLDSTDALDPGGVLQLAAQRMFATFAEAVMGMIVLDREHRIVWFNEGYQRFIALGPFADSGIIGRRIEEVVPNSLMGKVIDTGIPVVVDLLTNQYGAFLVSRLPLRNEQGNVIGGVSLVLADQPDGAMQPLIGKLVDLQRELEDTRRRLAAERRPKYSLASFVGSSAAVAEVKRQVRRVAATDTTVLLLGETGTGKELLAHAVHAASRRSAGRFVSVNIAAIPDTLLEAEFFGVAPGAYTGADRKGRDGKFKVADGGTLFLDEIGDMPMALQSKLLRVLQEQEIEPLGSNRVERVDVRIVSATSRDLEAMVEDGRFRADLYYRLNVMPIRLPPLRERLEDLPDLVDALSEDIARRSALPPRAVGPDAMELLASRPWPGNVRELRNVLEQASLMTDDLVLEALHFERLLQAAAKPGQPASRDLAGAVMQGNDSGPPAVPSACIGAAVKPLQQAMAEAQAQSIRVALAATKGNKAAAARLLGISRAALYEKLAAGGDAEGA
ncbi:sigma 54-interacting transcriptional regulator [Variovorax sp. EBFNA2]|uniref:sigma-54 interaction domain-containing protein n=1 Tax=Variovorax sp. EBFNA2 TaxID=3342097 RepID=UPI0029BFF2FA|nr:sigma 54-interacting transcriptional regulator [Variovorax boronicumulans]WPG36240.1 sigma 54-interacting transcriptional regulator [Variovorax boronicumulans]